MEQMKKRALQFISKYKFVVIILLVGIGLMLLPTSGRKSDLEPIQEPTQTAATDFSERLANVLGCIDGAGKVQVLLTQAQGEETVYQTDSDHTNNENETVTRVTTVTVTDAQRNQNGLIRQVNPPAYLGAIVVCEGAEDPAVRLAITQAVSKVTGLGADRISVLKMK